jgi:hypothetical protein
MTGARAAGLRDGARNGCPKKEKALSGPKASAFHLRISGLLILSSNVRVFTRRIFVESGDLANL